jgi:hypothetical protein
VNIWENERYRIALLHKYSLYYLYVLIVILAKFEIRTSTYPQILAAVMLKTVM